MKIKKIFYKKLSIVLLSGFVLINHPVATVKAEEKIELKEDELKDIENIENNINKELEGKASSKTKEKIIKEFIKIIDFIYFDTEINGIKFNDLNDEGKAKVLDIVINIDSKIEKKFPNYKNDLKDDYKNVVSTLKDKAADINEKIKDKIGEDNYNNFKNGLTEFEDNTKNALDVTKNIVTDTYSSGKQKVKSGYSNLKNKHN